MFKRLEKFHITNKNISLDAEVCVPNDIIKSLYDNGIIQDPYFGLNHNSLRKYLDEDYEYTTSFSFAKNDMPENHELFISFKGIDLLSDIYLNGELLGATDNMFKRYTFNITDKVVYGNNELKVVLHSTTKYMDGLDCERYFGVFNVPRILIRKEQCGFGWDWAPNIPGYGIWQEVELYSECKQKIADVHYSANDKGDAVFFIENNYSTKDGYDFNGNLMVNPNKFDDYIKVSLTKNPNEDFTDCYTEQIKVTGFKSFIAIKNPQAKLWWPIGYGEQPLYSYKVEILRDGEVISEKHGKLAYRTVEFKEDVIDNFTLSHTISVNGREVFIKGSCWVPIECFTGEVKDEKYERLIQMAKDGNFNMLRVWGGGIYEKDIFYDLCDKLGIMVWQDLMFACADLPEDNAEWVKNTCEEVEYQVKRLRNHPSIVYWCGGNEKTGSFGALMSYGDWFTNVTLRGIVTHNDSTRPFIRQSPCSKTDSANDINSGETHYNCYGSTFLEGLDTYRQRVSENVVPFISECAIQGPHSEQSFRKIFPEDKLWPMNEYWDDRLMRNPYAVYKESFAYQQNKIVEDFYGKPKSLKEFIAKAMMVHAETMRCEIEHQRALKGVTSGIMNWMFSEIYPSATWSVIDYYLEPKQVYFDMKKSYAPVYMSFYLEKDKNVYLFGVNDTAKDEKVQYTYGLKSIDGDIIWQESGSAVLDTVSALRIKIDKEYSKKDSYMFVSYSYGGVVETTVWSYELWRDCSFKKDYEVKKVQLDKNAVEVTIFARSFAKACFLSLPENCKYSFSDNYVDVEAGSQKKIIVTGEGVDANAISVEDYSTRVK